MDRLRRWRSSWSAGRAGAWRAGLTALATAALALLLAILFHLGVAAVAVAILGSLPTAYLGWRALTGAISPPQPAAPEKPTYGRPVRRWDPVELGVHQVIGGGPMPAYIRRPHDELLRAVLDPAVAASRLVVVRGGSSTGKTRAAYEAVADRLSDWQLDYPLDPGALTARLEAGIPARTVLWLGELRHYADGGAAVLGRLADLLQGEGCLVITTMWPEQWNTCTAAARGGPSTADPAGTAGRLLERLPKLTGSHPDAIDRGRGGVIDVPDRFTTAEMTAADRAGDPLLEEAAAAAASTGQDGQVTQYLAGVPDLLDRYEGPGGYPYGQAVITAAMDATRLGHASPLPAALLQDAAVGYLTGLQRTKDIASWRDTALAWATEQLKGAVRALQPVPPPSGTGIVGYQVADYLDQHGRRTRQDQLGPASFWDALTTHAASAGDLGQAARDRGLYRHAAALWTTAVTLDGSTYEARQLINHLRQVSPVDTTRAARWAVGQVSLDNPRAVARLLRELREAGVSDAVTALADRAAGQASLGDPEAVAVLLRELREAGVSDAVTALLARWAADQASLGDPEAVAVLLRELREAGVSDAVTALLDRDPAAHASLDDPGAVAWLLRALREAGASDAVTALLDRDPAAHARLGDPVAVAWLLGELRVAGASDAVTALLDRDRAGQASLGDPGAVAYLLATLSPAGASDAVTALLARDPAGQASLGDPEAVARLLRELRKAGASDAVTALLDRDPAGQASLGDPGAVAALLRALREAGASDAVTALLDRDPAGQASLGDPGAVAYLLEELREAGASDAVTALLARDPAAHARLGDPGDVAWLLEELREAGASDAVTALADRAAGQASLDNPEVVAGLLRALREAGASDAVTALLDRDPAGQASLGDPGAVAGLLEELREAGASDAVTALADRAAGQASLDDPGAVAGLLEELREAGASDAVTALADRAAGQASLDNPGAVARLLRALREAGASDAVTALLARDPAGQASLDDPGDVAWLLEELREAGASDAVTALADQAPNAGMFDLFLEVRPDEAISYRFGREPDGAPSQSWRWQEPTSQPR